MKENIREELQKPYPEGFLTTRKVGGYSVSAAEGWKVIDLLNELFGYDGWEDRITRYEEVEAVHNPEEKDSKRWFVGVECRVLLSVLSPEFEEPDGNCRFECTREDVGHGTGWGTTKTEARESAGKEAVTDALKRASRQVGRVLGLSIYDKDDKTGESNRYEGYLKAISAVSTSDELRALGQKLGSDIDIPKKYEKAVKKAFAEKANSFKVAE